MSLSKENQHCLLDVAKKSIAHGLLTGKPLKVNSSDYPAELKEFRATFVTLHRHNELRGCIGVLEAIRPMVADVAENAFSAAFNDHRFAPLTAEEFQDVQIHLSLLTPAEPMSFNSEQDLLEQLKPGVDGLILKEGYKKATFLPSVWETLPGPEQFLRHLKQKAGLPADYWSEQIQFLRYQAEIIG